MFKAAEASPPPAPWNEQDAWATATTNFEYGPRLTARNSVPLPVSSPGAPRLRGLYERVKQIRSVHHPRQAPACVGDG